MEPVADTVEVRDAAVEDAAAIARIYVDTWRDTYDGILSAAYLAKMSVEKLSQRWRQLLRRPHELVLVAVLHDEVVAFCSGGLETSGDPFFRGEVFTLYVTPEHQRRGIGEHLLAEMLARLEHLAPVIVQVLEKNDGARRFYVEMGGVPVRRGSQVVGGQAVETVTYAFFDVID